MRVQTAQAVRQQGDAGQGSDWRDSFRSIGTSYALLLFTTGSYESGGSEKRKVAALATRV